MNWFRDKIIIENFGRWMIDSGVKSHKNNINLIHKTSNDI